MNDIAIEISNLSKSYATGFMKKSTPIISNINLEIKKGEAWALIGSNGAGKTTTLYCLLGLIKPDQGHIKILNRSPNEPLLKKSIGFQSEIFYTYDFLTAEEVLTYYGLLAGIAKDEILPRVRSYLNLLGLYAARKKMVKHFSKGMTQRLGLANSLLKNPEIIIWDEPCSGLDPEGRRLVTKLAHQLISEGKTLLFSSHVLADVEQICSHVCLIKHGKIVLKGKITDIKGTFQEKSLEDIYMEHVA